VLNFKLSPITISDKLGARNANYSQLTDTYTPLRRICKSRKLPNQQTNSKDLGRLPANEQEGRSPIYCLLLNANDVFIGYNKSTFRRVFFMKLRAIWFCSIMQLHNSSPTSLHFVTAVGFSLAQVLIGPLDATTRTFFAANSAEQSAGETADDTWTEIHCRTTLQYEIGPNGNQNFFAPLELDRLEAGKRYKLLITTANPTNSAVYYSRIRVDCACAKIETSIDEIPALGEAQFSMYLTPSNIISDRPIATSARFVDHESGQLRIRLQVLYHLSGVFGFNADRFTLEIPSGEKLIVGKLPVVVQPPVTLDQLELKLSDNLRDSTIVLRANPDNERLAYIEVTASRDLVAAGNVLGEIVLEKQRGDARSVAILSIQQEQRLSVFPESVRLVRENSNKPFVANATVRVAKARTSLTDRDGELPSNDQVAPRIELYIDGNPARLNITPLGKTGIYRVKIAYDGPLEVNSEGNVEANWGISYNGENRIIKSYAFSPTLDHEREGDK
jgi:hypothetical protein